MEDFPNTMKALETLIPNFFMGAEVLYDKANQALHDNSKTANRKGKNVYQNISQFNKIPQKAPF